MSRRVVITGMGVVSPVGNDIDTFFENLKNGVCGIESFVGSRQAVAGDAAGTQGADEEPLE